jgi:hypothetical protein
MNATFSTLCEVEAAQTANESGVRPIGELMSEVLARYGIELCEDGFRPAPGSSTDLPFATSGSFAVAELAAW